MVYFDNAATSFPKPIQVQRAAAEAIRFYGGNPGRSGHNISMRTAAKVFSVREKAAAMFGAQPENVIFTLNCTMALNMAIKGAMAGGGHVVLSSMEHNSAIRPVHAMSRTGEVQYSIARVEELDPERTVQNFRSELRQDTRLVVCTYASNLSGTVLPIREIGAMCRENGILFLVDAAQGAGIFPIHMENLGIDILCAAGHKGLFGTTGTGLLILGEGVELATILEGGTGSASLDLEQPDFYPDRLESGTINTVGVLSMGAGMDYLNARGIGRIYRREMDYCAWVYRELSRMPHVKLLAESFRMGEKAPIVSFNVGDFPSEEVAAYLNRRGFALRGGFHCAGLAHCTLGTQKQGAVRFSPSHFNTPQQIAQFLTEIQKIKKIGLPKG